ncbi:heme-containing dehydratase protein [Xylariaceae sp. FL1272]|nr:heme-containing dehydratase protein [Xylariaceae sp. FL1272]
MSENAIPRHLQRDRSVPERLPKKDYEPPYPSYIPRLSKTVTDLVMGVFGAQFMFQSDDTGDAMSKLMSSSLRTILNPPRSPERIREWWGELDAPKEPHGWFIEIFFPTIDRLESQHAYWGSMRDRLPLAQTDLPRGRQDGAATDTTERELYLSEMHPVLSQGMDFLRDHGNEVGCYSCRLMDIVNSSSGKIDLDRTFGLAYFDEVASLERWSKEHPTHLKIFGGFHRYAQKLHWEARLRLFHDIFVLKSEQQLVEYVGCHGATGMLTAVNGHPGKDH